MLSKCANPECSEQFRYLHQGKMFCLIPAPKAAAATVHWSFSTRFWLCERCSKNMKVTWDGVRTKVVRLTAGDPASPTSPGTEARPRKSAALTAPGRRSRWVAEACTAVASWQTEGVAAITRVLHSLPGATDFSETSRRAVGRSGSGPPSPKCRPRTVPGSDLWDEIGGRSGRTPARA